MSEAKRQRRKQAGPAMDAEMISYSNSPIPGMPPGPGNMNGNPQNFTSYGAQASSLNGGIQENLYRDGQFQYPQMGADVLNPLQVPRSTLQQNTPLPGRGRNKTAPYGMQQQPPGEMADRMESMRLGGEAQQRGLFPSPMGLTGMPAVPGGMNPQIAGQSGNTLPLSPQNSMGPMTPGSQKVTKKKGQK